MARTLEEARQIAMELTERDRLLLAEQLVGSVAPTAAWREAWNEEAEKRYRRLVSGEDPGLTLDEFWSDHE